MGDYRCRFSGELLKKVRISKGVTQYDLSRETGIFQATISRWEQNKNEPRITEIAKVSKVLGCFIEDFLV